MLHEEDHPCPWLASGDLSGCSCLALQYLATWTEASSVKEESGVGECACACVEVGERGAGGGGGGGGGRVFVQ